jgi:hypothetical protein
MSVYYTHLDIYSPAWAEQLQTDTFLAEAEGPFARLLGAKSAMQAIEKRAHSCVCEQMCEWRTYIMSNTHHSRGKLERADGLLDITLFHPIHFSQQGHERDESGPYICDESTAAVAPEWVTQHIGQFRLTERHHLRFVALINAKWNFTMK